MWAINRVSPINQVLAISRVKGNESGRSKISYMLYFLMKVQNYHSSYNFDLSKNHNDIWRFKLTIPKKIKLAQRDQSWTFVNIRNRLFKNSLFRKQFKELLIERQIKKVINSICFHEKKWKTRISIML